MLDNTGGGGVLLIRRGVLRSCHAVRSTVKRGSQKVFLEGERRPEGAYNALLDSTAPYKS